MKNIMLQQGRRMFLAMAVLLSAVIVMGYTPLRAGDWGGHQQYSNQNGFYDGQHRYHQFDHYRGHRGYWDQRSGVSFFINVG